MSACVHFATTYRIRYSTRGWLKGYAEEFFDALNELGCDYLHVDNSDLYEVEKTEARKVLRKLRKRDPGDYKVNGISVNEIYTALEEALKKGEKRSKWLHFFVF